MILKQPLDIWYSLMYDKKPFRLIQQQIDLRYLQASEIFGLHFDVIKTSFQLARTWFKLKNAIRNMNNWSGNNNLIVIDRVNHRNILPLLNFLNYIK